METIIDTSYGSIILDSNSNVLLLIGSTALLFDIYESDNTEYTIEHEGKKFATFVKTEEDISPYIYVSEHTHAYIDHHVMSLHGFCEYVKSSYSALLDLINENTPMKCVTPLNRKYREVEETTMTDIFRYGDNCVEYRFKDDTSFISGKSNVRN